DLVQRAHEVGAPARAVAVDAYHAGGGKSILQRLLDPLRAATDRLQIDVSAGGAGARHRLLGTAVVAAKPHVSGMQHHSGGAALAGGAPAAGFAGEHRCVTAAIDE